MNILIDELPQDYKGYLINYGFRSGILISECLADDNFEDNTQGGKDKIYTAFRILYGKGIPPFSIAIDGLNWFLKGGENGDKSGKTENEEILFSFSTDKNIIYSAFMLTYGINLNKTNLHFFEFLALFNDLNKTAFRNIINIRSMKPKDIRKYNKETQLEIIKLKRELSLKNKRQILKQDTKFDKLINTR